jgi:hypothetical protein
LEGIYYCESLMVRFRYAGTVLSEYDITGVRIDDTSNENPEPSIWKVFS